MSWIDRVGIIRTGWRIATASMLLLLSLKAFAFEPEPPDGTEIWLVTYGPGEIYWQRFGHNAIWVRDDRFGLDHTFNFGFFDFEQENFFLRFLMGRMLYFSAAQNAGDEFAQYRAENRGIRAQRLDMTQGQKEGLIRYLLNETRPENRDYLYDYYRNNCSTRVRDALDRALSGAISRESDTVAAAYSWRDHTRRLTHDDFWIYLGLESVLGLYVDRPISLWDEMFIPGQLSDAVAATDSLVLEDRVLFESSLPPPRDRPGATWPRYLLAAFAALAAAALFTRWLDAALVARSWLAVSGMAGLAILFFWFGTDHMVAGLNTNILVFNPLWLVYAAWKASWRSALPVTGIFSALSLAIALIPGQYTADVVAAFVPLNLGAAWVIQNVHGRHRPAANSSIK